MDKVVAITGASSGMGLETAKLMAKSGLTVYGGARHLGKMRGTTGVHPVKLDVTDTASKQHFVDTIMKEQGRIDILINSAGYGELGPVENISMATAHQQFETNFLAPLN
ncbi:short chain dehydrogenase [Levilactobacillus brevis]|nr:short chain dehydrogenase [Levilactobacillus brevis]